MVNEKDDKFVDGFYAKRAATAPDFILANVSINTEKFTEFLKENTNRKGYLNINIKRSMNGVIFAVVNTWDPRNEN